MIGLLVGVVQQLHVELLLFALSFALHQALFRGKLPAPRLPQNPKKGQVQLVRGNSDTEPKHICTEFTAPGVLADKPRSAPRRSHEAYEQLVRTKLRPGAFNQARAVVKEMKEVGFVPSQAIFRDIITTVLRSDKSNCMSLIWEVVTEMQEMGVKPNRSICSILLKRLDAKSDTTNVQRTLDLTTAMDEPMDEALLTSVVEACVRVGRPDLLASRLRLLQDQSGDLVNGANTFGCLIKASGQVGDVDSVWRYWTTMRARHIQPASVTIGCMVEAVVSNGDVDGGYELIQTLIEDEQCCGQVNAIIYCSVLKGYARLRRMERVWSVWEELLARNIEPTVVTFNAMIDACAQNRSMNAVPELVLEMERRGLTPNLITYSTMLKGFCKRGDMPAAFRILEEMRRANLRPDEVTYNTLFDGCAQSNLADEGERLLQEMEKEGIVPTSFTLSVLVKLMGNCQRLDRAFELVDQLSRRYSFKPNTHVCANLVQACVANRAFTRGLEVYEKLKRDKQHVEPRIYQFLLRGGLTAGAHTVVIAMLRDALHLKGANGNDKRRGPDKLIDNSFVGEVLSSLASSSLSKEVAELLPPLLNDIKDQRPRLRIDTKTEQRIRAFAR